MQITGLSQRWREANSCGSDSTVQNSVEVGDIVASISRYEKLLLTKIDQEVEFNHHVKLFKRATESSIHLAWASICNELSKKTENSMITTLSLITPVAVISNSKSRVSTCPGN